MPFHATATVTKEYIRMGVQRLHQAFMCAIQQASCRPDAEWSPSFPLHSKIVNEMAQSVAGHTQTCWLECIWCVCVGKTATNAHLWAGSFSYIVERARRRIEFTSAPTHLDALVETKYFHSPAHSVCVHRTGSGSVEIARSHGLPAGMLLIHTHSG